MSSLKEPQKKSTDQDRCSSKHAVHRHLSQPPTPSSIVTPTSSEHTRVTTNEPLSPISFPALSTVAGCTATTSLLDGENDLFPEEHAKTLSTPSTHTSLRANRSGEIAGQSIKRKDPPSSVSLDLEHHSHQSVSISRVPTEIPEHPACPWGKLAVLHPEKEAYKAFAQCASRCQVSNKGELTKDFPFVNKHVIGEHFVWGDFDRIGLSPDDCRQALEAYRACDKRFDTASTGTKFQAVVKKLFHSQILQESMICSHLDKPQSDSRSNRTWDHSREMMLEQMRKDIKHTLDVNDVENPRPSAGKTHGFIQINGANSAMYPPPWSPPDSTVLHGSKHGQEPQQSVSAVYQPIEQQSKKARTTAHQHDYGTRYQLDYPGDPKNDHIALFRHVEKAVPPTLTRASDSSSHSPQDEPDLSSRDANRSKSHESDSDLQGLRMPSDNLAYGYTKLLKCSSEEFQELIDGLF